MRPCHLSLVCSPCAPFFLRSDSGKDGEDEEEEEEEDAGGSNKAGGMSALLGVLLSAVSNSTAWKGRIIPRATSTHAQDLYKY